MSALRIFVLVASAITLSCVGNAQESKSGSHQDRDSPAIFLHTEFLLYKHTVEDGLTYRLGRELVRQAFLISAREELGITCYDGTLREEIPDDDSAIQLALLERLDFKKNWHVKLYALSNDASDAEIRDLWTSKPIWEHVFQGKPWGGVFYKANSRIFEDATRKEFVDALRNAGFNSATSRPQVNTAAKIDAALIAKWETTLQQVDFVTHCGVIRAVHSNIKQQGETPELLSILVRAYANLSMMTQHQWNATSEVFAARAILYARRLATTANYDVSSIWHRAYVWTLIGAHQHALEDLVVIRRKNKLPDADQPVELSGANWTKLIHPSVHFDRAKLSRIANDHPTLGPWAQRLRFQLASANRNPLWMDLAAREVFKHSPTAYGVYNELAHHGGSLTAKRFGASVGPLAMSRFLPASLATADDIPQSLTQAVKNNAKPTMAFSSLPSNAARRLRVESVKKSSAGFSWSALAYLLEEEQFVQAASYLGNAANAVETPLGSLVDRLVPLVGEHRYAAYIDSFRYNRRSESEKYAAAVQNIVIEDPRKNMSKMMSRLSGILNDDGVEIGKHAYAKARRNFTLQGLVEDIFLYTPEWAPKTTAFGEAIAKEFAVIAPHSELSLRVQLQTVKAPDIAQLSEFEKQLKKDPTAFRLLGQHYASHNLIEEAIRCYQKSLDAFPTRRAATALADHYFNRGELVEWEKALLDFLDTQETGLDHAAVRATLAYGLSGQGKWAQAKPHAIKSAETYSGQGLSVASHITEGLAQWEESEKWIRELSQSYPTTSGYEWYFWCRRTGRGDDQLARRLAEKYFAADDIRPNRVKEILRTTFHVLEDNKAAAIQSLQRELAYGQVFSCNFFIAELASENGEDETERDAVQAMKTVIDSMNDEEEGLIMRIEITLLAVRDSKQITNNTLNAMERDIQQLDRGNRVAFAYLFARTLDKLGKPKQAAQYYQRSLDDTSGDPYYRTLSGAALVAKNGPGPSRSNKTLNKDNLWLPD